MTFALPATGLPGALELTHLRHERGVCLQLAVHIEFGRKFMHEARGLNDLVDQLVLCAALRGEGKNVTRGSMPQRHFAVCADEIAIAASCSAVGFGFTAQSPKTIMPSSPYALFGSSMIKQLDTTEIRHLDDLEPSSSVSPVVLIAPATMPSARPFLIIIAAKKNLVSFIIFSAPSGVMPFSLRIS